VNFSVTATCVLYLIRPILRFFMDMIAEIQVTKLLI